MAFSAFDSALGTINKWILEGLEKMMKKSFRVGARGSRLSLAQTEGALDFLAKMFPGTSYRTVVVETPGDRDLTTPIETSAPDFFTRDLDTAVREGRIDFAIHSAKDLPDPIADDLDWFWLPTREDPRDCLVLRSGDGDLHAARRANFRIGISSDRRRAYATAHFPKAKALPIRGAIDARLEQLRDGKFDAILMAMAGLRRLDPELFAEGTPRPFDILPIPLAELAPPEAQGVLAVVFKKGDTRLTAMRAHFVKAVRFVSAGVGDAGLCTVAGQRDLAAADVVLYDDLLGDQLVRDLPAHPLLIHVGKRCGAHTLKQPEITQLICDEARKGRRVVRLKGGDAGLFGRLAEETDALAELGIPFVVRPGVSALTAATTGTGLLLTRRGESRGFTVYTPRSKGTETPQVMFMATKMLPEECAKLLKQGYAPATPCALVWDAAGPNEEIFHSTVGAFAGGLQLPENAAPGLFIVGSVAEREWPRLGVYEGRRVLVTCSAAVQEKACLAIEDRGGRAVRWPLIELRARRELTCLAEAEKYDAIVLTSPSSARIFFKNCPCDRRHLGEFYTCGAGTDAELRRWGFSSDVMPAQNFSAEGLIEEIKGLDLRGRRVLRLRSVKAGDAVAKALRRAGANVDDEVLYDNVFCIQPFELPKFDDVYFASASAVESFIAQYGVAKLRGKGIYVMGGPTRAALPERLRKKAWLLTLD